MFCSIIIVCIGGKNNLNKSKDKLITEYILNLVLPTFIRSNEKIPDGVPQIEIEAARNIFSGP